MPPSVGLCPLLKQLFSPNLKCHSIASAFSTPPILSERFSSSSTYQYFSPLARLLHFQTYLAKTICGESKGACVNEAASLSYANYVDIDYDAISHAVTLTAFCRGDVKADAAKTLPRKWKGSDSLEVGVLQAETPDEPEELKLGGYLAVVGEDDKPGIYCPPLHASLKASIATNPARTETTLFSFPSRHHSLPPSTPLTFTTHFQQPTGLHPKLDITFPSPQHLTPPKQGSCALHADLTLPSALFLDRYQFSDPLFLASQNLVALRSLSGEQDLEAPDWVIKRWGSAALFELATPLNDTTAGISGGQEPWTVTIPTHLRYLQQASNTITSSDSSTVAGQTNLDIPYPSLFWACEAEDGLKMSVNPFDRINLGYDGLFGPKTMFYHVPPALPEGQHALVERLQVPVLEPEGPWTNWVQAGTLVAVMLGFGWVLRTLLRGVGMGGGGAKRKGGEGKKGQ